MHPRVIAQRRAQAHERMTEAAGLLAGRFGIALEDRPPVRALDAATGALLDLEQTAAFLEALVAATAPAPEPEPAKPAATVTKPAPAPKAKA